MSTCSTRTQRLPFLVSAAALGLGLGILSISPAAAQDALGSGDALDANLSTAGTRNAATPNESLAYRVRNLLVTGNVAGGRGFRGSVGYTAAEDFRGALGSDDLYQFRAESAYSAPSFILFRDQLTDLQIGQDLGTFEYRRDTTGATLDSVMASSRRIEPDQRLTELRLDRLISDVSLAENIERASESRPIGVGMDAEGNMVVPTTTNVIGLELLPMQEAQVTAGMTVLDKARLREDLVRQQQAGTTPEQGPRYATTYAELLAMDTRIQGTMAEQRVEPQMVQYDDILKTVAERYTDGESLDQATADELDREFAGLRDYLRSTDEATADEDVMTDRPAGVDSGLEVQLPGMETGDDQPATDESTATPLPRTPDVMPTLESFGIVLRHGQTLQTYASGDENRFNELVRSAEEAMATGEYFWAERRFTRALRFQQFHPLASAGKAHAQVGAGLYMPASLQLRRVLSQYPEMIDVMYDPAIMPTRVRLAQNVDAIRQRLDQGVEPEMMGFLLAYLGHQLDDRALIDQGLSAMQDANPEDRMLPLLRTIWADVPDPDGNAASP